MMALANWRIPASYKNLKPEVDLLIDEVRTRDDCASIDNVTIASQPSDRGEPVAIVTCISATHHKFRLHYEIRSRRLVKGRAATLNQVRLNDPIWQKDAWRQCEQLLDTRLIRFTNVSLSLPDDIQFINVDQAFVDDQTPLQRAQLRLKFSANTSVGNVSRYIAVCEVDRHLNVSLEISASNSR